MRWPATFLDRSSPALQRGQDGFDARFTRVDDEWQAHGTDGLLLEVPD